ncbi:MAG: alpha/beta hydrolase, partial [Actinomycetota bacterium]|nr:alpha/beta hydrolase [Actinomycetota bacterium]
MPEVFADQELAAFVQSYNELHLPSAAETGAEALRAATLERTAARPRGPELAEVRDVTVRPVGPAVRI